MGGDTNKGEKDNRELERSSGQVEAKGTPQGQSDNQHRELVPEPAHWAAGPLGLQGLHCAQGALPEVQGANSRHAI